MMRNRHVALLCGLLALASVAGVVVRSVRKSADGVQTSGQLTGPSTALRAAVASNGRPLSDDQLVVYFFHGNVRCRACRRIEQFAREVVAGEFAEELRQGSILWRLVNYEQPAQREMAVRYDVIAPTVVLVERRQSREFTVQNLMPLWDLVEDPEGFKDLLREKINALR